jgi:putative flippase GtrA
VEAAIVHNFIWHERFTWAECARLSARRSTLSFLKFNATTGMFSIAGNLLLMRVFAGITHLPYVAANLLSISSCSILNFLVSDRLVFRTNRDTVH